MAQERFERARELLGGVSRSVVFPAAPAVAADVSMSFDAPSGSVSFRAAAPSVGKSFDAPSGSVSFGAAAPSAGMSFAAAVPSADVSFAAGAPGPAAAPSAPASAPSAPVMDVSSQTEPGWQRTLTSWPFFWPLLAALLVVALLLWRCSSAEHPIEANVQVRVESAEAETPRQHRRREPIESESIEPQQELGTYSAGPVAFAAY